MDRELFSNFSLLFFQFSLKGSDVLKFSFEGVDSDGVICERISSKMILWTDVLYAKPIIDE